MTLRSRRLIVGSTVLITLVGLAVTSNASVRSHVAEAAQLRSATAEVVSTTKVGPTTVTLARDAAGVYTVLDVNRAPGRIAYLVRGNVLRGTTTAKSAVAWVPGQLTSAQTVPFTSITAALPPGCGHWRAGPFLSYGHVIVDSSTNCSAAQVLITNSAHIYINNSTTSLWNDNDANANVSWLSSRALKVCNGSAWTTHAGGSQWRVNAQSGSTMSGWGWFQCGL